MALTISFVPAADTILRPRNTSSIPLPLPNLTRKLVLEAILRPQLKQLKNHQKLHIQHRQRQPALAARLFTIQTRTPQLIVNRHLAHTLTTAQAMGKEARGQYPKGNLQDDEEEAHLASDFPVTCRIGHLMF